MDSMTVLKYADNMVVHPTLIAWQHVVSKYNSHAVSAPGGQRAGGAAAQCL